MRDDNHSLINQILTFVFGAVAGFATAILIDEKRRDQIVDKAQDMKKQAGDRLRETKDDLVDRARDTLDDLEEEVDKKFKRSSRGRR